jgi:hypothetical protein
VRVYPLAPVLPFLATTKTSALFKPSYACSMPGLHLCTSDDIYLLALDNLVVASFQELAAQQHYFAASVVGSILAVALSRTRPWSAFINFKSKLIFNFDILSQMRMHII